MDLEPTSIGDVVPLVTAAVRFRRVAGIVAALPTADENDEAPCLAICDAARSLAREGLDLLDRAWQPVAIAA